MEHGTEKIPWRRDIPFWETELVDELMQLVASKNSSKDCQDRRVWRDDVEGQLSVRSSYFMLHNTE